MQEDKGKIFRVLGVMAIAVLVIEAVFWGNYYFLGKSPSLNQQSPYMENIEAKHALVLNANRAAAKITLRGRVTERSGNVITVDGLIDNTAAKKKFELSAAKFYSLIKSASGSEAARAGAVGLKENPGLLSSIKAGTDVSVTFLGANENDDVIVATMVTAL